MVQYIGNGAYCYANSMAMALDSLGVDEFDPSFIEVVTTVGFGITYVRHGDTYTLLFSHHRMNPDVGIDFAFDSLGYRALAWHADPADDDAEWQWREAQERLADGLRNGPVIVGPLDMGYLRYNPHAVSGADHFVVIYAQDADGVHLHDPEGYPYVTLALDDLRQAWRADRIGYKRGPYTLRSDITPGRIFARGIILRTTLHQMARNLAETQPPQWSGAEVAINGAALTRAAAVLRADKPEGLRGMLSGFALPVAAKRAADTVRFLKSAVKPLKESADGLKTAAAIRERQARLLGRMQVAAVAAQWDALADLLAQHAEEEAAFTAAIQTIVRELPTQLPS